MQWMAGAIVLMSVGVWLRRLLWFAPKSQRPATGLAPMDIRRQEVYDSFAPEVEARTVMLGISLDDAFEERSAGRHEIAWRMILLSAAEWDGMAKIVAGMLAVLSKHLPGAQVVVTPRGIRSDPFKSRQMVDYMRMHELMDQLVFSSHRRFQLQLRLLRRAAEIVTGEFRQSCCQVEKTGDPSGEVWKQIDLYFHDFDLIAKEALLAFRALLVCLPLTVLPQFSADLNALLYRRVRSRSVSVTS